MASNTLKHIGSASRYLVILAAVLVFAGWLVSTPSGFFGKADAIGYAVCHQISARSFHIGSLKLPLCARCSGMYLGAMTGLVFQAVAGRRRTKIPHWSILVVLGVLLAAFGIDGLNSYIYLIKQVSPGALPQVPNIYIPNNTLRLLTGSGMGLGIAALLFPAFNQTVWADADEKQRALSGWKAFGLLLGIQVLLDLLVLTQSPIVLYPLAIIGILGVLVLLVMVYSMIWVMLLGRENKYQNIRQLWFPLVGGFAIAMIQIFAVDLLRFWLTGTWGEIPLHR